MNLYKYFSSHNVLFQFQNVINTNKLIGKFKSLSINVLEDTVP